jgi:ABC-type Mn2+/Zn2+ transport system permease subunit
MNIIEFLGVPIFQRALIAAVVAGGTMSLLGIVIVIFNLTTIRFALMHFGILGGAVGLVFGANPLTAALAAIAAGALLLGPLSDKMKLDTGLIGAFFMTGSIAIAFLLFYKAGVPAQDVFSLFTGSILTLTNVDLAFIFVLGIVILLVFIIFFREIQLTLYDAEQAEWLGIPAKKIRNTLLFLTGLAIGVAMKIVGALLIDALILLSAMSAFRLARNFKQLMILTACFGILTAAGGLLFSMAFDFPTGASITLAGVLILLVNILIAK